MPFDEFGREFHDFVAPVGRPMPLDFDSGPLFGGTSVAPTAPSFRRGDGSLDVDFMAQRDPEILEISQDPSVRLLARGFMSLSPAQRSAFLKARAATQDPVTFLRDTAAVSLASRHVHGADLSSATGGDHAGYGPAGTPVEGPSLPPQPGPCAPEDPAYAFVLSRSGCRYPSQRFTHDPSAGRR